MDMSSTRSGRIRAVAAKAAACLLCAALALSTSPAAGLGQAHADITGNDWHYVKKKEVKCPESVKEDAEEADNAEENQAAPSSGGDWTKEGTEAYKSAKSTFEMLTENFGFSGAAAAGVLGAIAGEANFAIHRGEDTNFGQAWFEENSKLPHENQCYYVGGAGGHSADYANKHSFSEVNPHTGMGNGSSNVYMIGGGGLFAFTPYVKFTESEYWGKYDSKDGWAAVNQVAFALSESVATGKINGISSEEFMSLSDPATAEYHWYHGYERGLGDHPEREADARTANSIFNKSNVQADRSKWEKVFALAPHRTSGATLDAFESDDGDEEADDGDCGEADDDDGAVDAHLFVKAAVAMCADKNIGYSQSTRCLNPNVDCSSFTWYCLTRSGIESLAEGGVMGTYPMTTNTESETLTGAGFVRHEFGGSDDFKTMPAGSPIFYHGHSALFIGRYDAEWCKEHPDASYEELKAHEDDEGGKPLLAEASHGSGGDGDDLQGDDGVWYGSHEVSIHGVYDPGWEAYFTPDNVEGLDGDGGYGQDYASASDKQKAIVRATYSVGSPGGGWCAKWVSQVYAAAGCSYPGGNACDMWRTYCKSTNRDDLKVGMMIAVEHSGPSGDSWSYGHIGIYIGDNKVRHNIGSISECTVDEWISTYTYRCEAKWGFGPGF